MSEQTTRSSGAGTGPGGAPDDPIRVIISDDHAAFRLRLRSYLERSGEMVVVGEAGSGEETLERLAEQSADVLCLDIHMLGPPSPQLIQRVHALYPGLHVVMVTMHNENQYVTESLRAGALGYVLKESLTTRLLPAIRAVCHGKRYVDPAVIRDSA